MTKETKTEAPNVVPLGINIVIVDDPSSEETDSGLLIPVESQEKPLTGIVGAIGFGCSEEFKKAVDLGDRVAYKKNRGTVVNIDNKIFRILTEGELLAKI